MTEQRTLHLTLSEKPFQVMVTGEKPVEFRKPSDWIKSRLFNKDGSRKDYDVVKLVNGYGKDKPFFIAIFNGFDQASEDSIQTYSNGLEVNIEENDFRIFLGDITKKGNLKQKVNLVSNPKSGNWLYKHFKDKT